MLNPSELYALSDDLPALDRPVLVHALTGFVDAGNASRLAREHLLTIGSPRTVATFDLDQLYDYRSRRPAMLFVEDHWEHYERPQLLLRALRDADGTEFLLLDGPEPDLQWERFTAAVLELIERFDVRATVGLNAIPMAVPHTRPTGVTAHGTSRDLISGFEPWLQRVQVPASVGNLLEFRIGQDDRDAFGFAVHVPHYVAQAEFPAAAEKLLSCVSEATGLRLPTDELHRAAESVRAEIDLQIAQADEAASLVRALEEQYDAYTRGRQNNLLAESPAPLPTADEIGAELERFLAEHTRNGDDPPLG
ncbi:PAC2 family protein [Dactylosporangium fulvum]|uniref:PAC2 family protein n=1 Tax=Dactylosporangium fulvum TaxID=53359 RepID=A0ABY5VYP8_9ACTN|nr:PAC2 family protein [Dactylosporangium fulvum]UWP80891.1 PAC2 family protein [Dactylosporangium fulvum]